MLNPYRLWMSVMIRPVIKWSGSKRSQAEKIKALMPTVFNTYYEPFVGGGSILYAVSPRKAVCGDICRPLIEFWEMVKKNPKKLSNSYNDRWKKLQKEGHLFYYRVRERFNHCKNPEDLLFLTRTCVNGLIRFNANGDFNNSFHHTRKGIDPVCLEKIIIDWSERLQQAEFRVCSYLDLAQSMSEGDFAYLDPPYFHTKGRYYGTLNYQEFISFLKALNNKGVLFILSYDGRRGGKDYKVELPKEIYKRKMLIKSGNSSFGKVINGKIEQVLESLYLNF